MFSLEIIDIFYLVKKILVLPGLAAPRLARPRRAAPCILHLSVSGVKKSLSRHARPILALPCPTQPRLAFYIFQSIQSIAVTSNLP
jgi:hypothetical protein